MAGPHQPFGCPTRPALTKSYVCMYVFMYVRNVSELFVSKEYGLRFTTSTKGRNYNYKEEKQRQKTQIELSLFMM